MHVVMHKPLCLSAFDMQNIALNFSEINAVFNIFLLFIVSAQQKRIHLVLKEQRISPISVPFILSSVPGTPYHPRAKNRHAASPFPRARLMIKTDRYRAILARRMNTGNTFRISASAIAQHPTKSPAKIPNMPSPAS